MKWIDYLIALFSPQMRSTIELARLNHIWEKWNEAELTKEETLKLLLDNRWKYHNEKAQLLIEFLFLKTNFIIKFLK